MNEQLETAIHKALAGATEAGLTSPQIHSVVPGSWAEITNKLRRMELERKIILVNYPAWSSVEPYPRYISNLDVEPNAQPGGHDTDQGGVAPDREKNLREDLRSAINRASAENTSNTPDHLLAKYLRNCLYAFDEATKARDSWYGIAPRPGEHRDQHIERKDSV